MSRPILMDNDGYAAYNSGFDLNEMIDNLPGGLEREVRRILEFHTGRENAISRGRFLADLALMGMEIDERELRVCINQLRKSGTAGSWICSTGGENGGYWMAASQEELEEFLQREFDARAMDLHEQSSAMRKAAEKRWGRYSPEKQATMF